MNRKRVPISRIFAGLFSLLWFVATAPSGYGQQVPDENFDPKITNPKFERGNGPVILVDEGHHNFHTIEGRYSTFVKILRLDGYVVGTVSILSFRILPVSSRLRRPDST